MTFPTRRAARMRPARSMSRSATSSGRPGEGLPSTMVAVLGIAAAVAVALAVAGAAGARGQAAAITLKTTLDSGQEVPSPVGDISYAAGSFTGVVTKSGDGGASLAWRLTFSGLTGPAGAAHVHVAPRGQAGPIAIPLCGPCESPASGTASVDAATLEALESGGAYVNVHTAANKAGEVRGQIGVTATLRTALSARQEVPRPKGAAARARGTFTADITRAGTTGIIAWRLTHGQLTGRATAAHIHVGRPGKPGPVVVPLCGPCRSGVRKSARLQASVLSALETGRAYVNVHTVRNPAGEIRGQLPAVALRITP